MKRRAFLGFLGGAAASGPSIAKAAAGNAALVQSGFPSGNLISGAAPMSYAPSSAGAVSKLIRWVKKTGIPEWKLNDLKRQADYQRRNGLDPDLAALISVSPGFKARVQRKRNLDRVIDASIASIGRHAARQRFDDKIRSQFGEGLDWYD